MPLWAVAVAVLCGTRPHPHSSSSIERGDAVTLGSRSPAAESEAPRQAPSPRAAFFLSLLSQRTSTRINPWPRRPRAPERGAAAPKSQPSPSRSFSRFEPRALRHEPRRSPPPIGVGDPDLLNSSSPHIKAERNPRLQPPTPLPRATPRGLRRSATTRVRLPSVATTSLPQAGGVVTRLHATRRLRPHLQGQDRAQGHGVDLYVKPAGTASPLPATHDLPSVSPRRQSFYLSHHLCLPATFTRLWGVRSGIPPTASVLPSPRRTAASNCRHAGRPPCSSSP